MRFSIESIAVLRFWPQVLPFKSNHPGNIVRSHTRACSNIITRFAAESNANIAKSRKHFVNQLLPSHTHHQPAGYNHFLRYSLNFPREIAVKLNGLIPLYLPRLFVPPSPHLFSRNLVEIVTNGIDLMVELCFD